jgi:hypothetical protein
MLIFLAAILITFFSIDFVKNFWCEEIATSGNKKNSCGRSID